MLTPLSRAYHLVAPQHKDLEYNKSNQREPKYSAGLLECETEKDKWRTGHTAQERTKQMYTITTTPSQSSTMCGNAVCGVEPLGRFTIQLSSINL